MKNKESTPQDKTIVYFKKVKKGMKWKIRILGIKKQQESVVPISSHTNTAYICQSP